VTVRNAQGNAFEYQIVGVDEADAGLGLLAFTAPLARALLGRQVGDVIEFRAPRESAELEILVIGYALEGNEAADSESAQRLREKQR
jgi:transcription elongation factor GreB